jgi:hypothetical protein
MEGVTWTVWNQARTRFDEEWSAKTVTTVVWGSATLGGVAGALIGSRYGSTPGAASFVESAGLWSGAVGGLTASSLVSDDERADDAFMLATALSLNAGAAAAAWFSGTVQPSTARVRFLDLGGVSGGLIFGGLYVSLADDDVSSRPLAALTALGVTSGLLTAWFMTGDMNTDAFSSAPDPGPRLSLTPVGSGLGIGLTGLLD